jgi:hypothetical protein
MALTGVMGADFSKFTDAVDAAEIKLRQFEGGAAKVESALSRMGNAFSGQKVVQDATLMAKVFEDMGGAAAFTQKELARMSVTAEEAVKKLEALGKDVPDGIRKLADETKGAATSTESWTDNVKKLALQYLTFQGIMAAGRGAMNFIKDTIDQAGALSDLSASTRIAVEDLQTMQGAMREFGIEGDAMGRALFKASQAIAGGDAGVVAALKSMGLSLDEVRRMKGEELFTTLQNGLATLNGTARDTAAIELYGTKMASALGGAAEGTQAAIDRWRELNGVMSEETVAALDAAGENWDRLSQKITVWAATNVLGPITKGLNDFLAVIEKGAAAEAGWARVKDALLEAMGKEKHYFDDLALSLGIDTQAKIDNATATDQDATAGRRNADAIFAQNDALKAQRAAWTQHIADQKERNENNQKGIDLMTRDAALMADRAKFDKEEAEIHKGKMAAGKAYVEQMSEIAKVNKTAREFDAETLKQQTEIEKENQALIKSWGEAGAASSEAGSQAVDGATQAAHAQAQLNTQINLTIGNVKEWIELQQYTAAANAILSQNGLFTSGSQYDAIARMGSAFTGIQPRAGGGPVAAGSAYVVGEAGPELFLPGVSGTIAPNGGGASITNVFHLVDTESNLARRVSEHIMRSVRAGTQLATT